MKNPLRNAFVPKAAIAVAMVAALCASTAAVASPSSQVKPAAATQTKTASDLQPSECVTPALKAFGATCYTFTGQENWDHPNGKNVQLPVAVISGEGTDPNLEPLFYFPGGPGPSKDMQQEGRIQRRLADAGSRRLVLIGSRGLPLAKPALECPGIEKINHAFRRFAPDVYGARSLDARIKQQADHVKACYSKLKSEGIDVAQYTDYQIARDYDEVRKALGFNKINIYGISTGGGSVQTYLKYYDDHVRSAILGYPWGTALRNRPAIDELITAKNIAYDIMGICVRESKECASRFPDYLYAIDRAREKLDAKPYVTTVASEATSSGRLRIRIDGATFLGSLYYAQTPSFPDVYDKLPKALEAIERGDYKALDDYFRLDDVDQISASGWAMGHFWANVCGSMGENVPTPREATSMIKREPALMGYELNVFCAWWGERGDVPADLNTTVATNVPALAIHGQVDACCGLDRKSVV